MAEKQAQVVGSIQQLTGDINHETVFTQRPALVVIDDPAVESRTAPLSPAMQSYLGSASTTGGDFGWALHQLKAGLKVARKGWNGKEMYLVYVPPSAPKIDPDTPYGRATDGQSAPINGHIGMFTAQGAFQPGWLASQTDMLATDWEWVA